MFHQIATSWTSNGILGVIFEQINRFGTMNRYEGSSQDSSVNSDFAQIIQVI